MADLDRGFVELNELGRRDVDLRAVGFPFTENWKERVLRKHVLNVGDEQFLMLLLVMNAERENGFNLAK